MPVLLRGCVGIGHSAATHHSGNYYAMYAHFPGLRVVVPSTPVRRQGPAHAGPALRRPRALPRTPRGPLGSRGRCRRRTTRSSSAGRPSSARGRTSRSSRWRRWSTRSSKAAEALAREGISVELIDPRTVAPLDFETIHASVRKTGRLLIVDEDVRAVRRRRRDRGPDGGRRLRRPRRADPPAQRRSHADPATAPRWRRPSSRTWRRSPAPSAT